VKEKMEEEEKKMTMDSRGGKNVKTRLWHVIPSPFLPAVVMNKQR